MLLHGPLQGIGHDRRHFNQLFRQLRIAHCDAHRDVLTRDLGHFDNLLGIRHERIEELEHVWQLFHRLRRRIIEKKQQRDGIDNLLHSAPQNPLLRPGQGRNPVRPRPAELFFVEAEEAEGVCVGEEGARIAAVKFISRSSSPALAIIGRCALWCNFSAKAIATVIRSCFSHERSRRSRRRRAALSHAAEGCPLAIIT